MLIIASHNGAIGMDAAMHALKNGASALDAVEIATRLVEADWNDHTVGVNGYPNILGELELDASIMDGRSLDSGAVAVMRGYPYAISVARQVLERRLPHVLLAGAGAERFAKEIGAAQQENMLSEEIREVWRRRVADFGGVDDAALLDLVRFATDPERVAGTVNFIAVDGAGDIASAVSTSGWAWKYPGRVGDSPIIGAGNYADNRYGACACTGMGEMAIRAGTARSVVLYMKLGMSLNEAAQEAMRDLRDLGGDYIGHMSLVALDKDGAHIGLSSDTGRTYLYQTADMPQHAAEKRRLVELPRRWG